MPPPMPGAGPLNLITDIDGLLVGQAHDEMLRSGVTVLTADQPFTAGVHVMGGAPGTRETELLAPDRLVQQVDALVLSGGSAFGLDAAAGVMDGLRGQGRGLPVGDIRVPIVPAAILFDLANGGAKDWRVSPYPDLGRAALEARGRVFDLGSAGAGFGATTARLKGGIGSASWVTGHGVMLGALVAVNPVGCVTTGEGPQFWAAPFEQGTEFGGRGVSSAPVQLPMLTKIDRQATTLAIVATDATLDQAQLTRLAIAAHGGIARAILPSHTPFDGDLIFAVSTGSGAPVDQMKAGELGHAAACCLSRAVARAVFEARALPGDLLPSWASLYA